MIWLVIGSVIGVFLLLFGKYLWHGATVKMTSITYNEKSGIMTFNYEDNTKIEYKGNCTVWYRMPNFKRCSTLTESRLNEYWEMVMHHGGKIEL